MEHMQELYNKVMKSQQLELTYSRDSRECEYTLDILSDFVWECFVGTIVPETHLHTYSTYKCRHTPLTSKSIICHGDIKWVNVNKYDITF